MKATHSITGVHRLRYLNTLVSQWLRMVLEKSRSISIMVLAAAEAAIACVSILRCVGFPSDVRLVTSEYHMPRAFALFQQIFSAEPDYACVVSVVVIIIVVYLCCLQFRMRLALSRECVPTPTS